LNRRARKGDEAALFWNQESTLRVSLASGMVVVVLPQRRFDLSQSLCPLHARLPLPEQRESLSAQAAIRFCVLIAALAKYLHLPCLYRICPTISPSGKIICKLGCALKDRNRKSKALRDPTPSGLV
jgi:hypothetical protein